MTALGAPIRAWTGWVDAIRARESATALALFRIGMGLGVLLTVGSPTWRGLVPVLWIDVANGGYRSLGHGPWLVAWLGGPTPAVVWGLVITALVAGAAMAVGVGGRFASFVALVACENVLSINGHAGGSYDQLLTNGLWLAVLAGGEQTLSLTARLRTGTWFPAATAPAWPRWLVAWQLVLMYGTTGLQKVSAYWVPGGEASALYYILQQPEWHRRDASFVAYVFPLTQLATTVTWLWEVGAPLWIVAMALARTPTPSRRRTWANRVRWGFALLGIGMHAVIFVMMEVGPFSPLSLAFYAAMVHPFEWDAWFARWRRPPQVDVRGTQVGAT